MVPAAVYEVFCYLFFWLTEYILYSSPSLATVEMRELPKMVPVQALGLGRNRP